MSEVRRASADRHGVEWFQSERIAPALSFALLGAFALIVAAFGGSSRADAVQIAPLRPLATLFLIPALYLMDAKSWRDASVLVGLFGAFALWMGLQLIPLPPAIWHALPDRQIIAELDRLTGLGDQWRPLSLAPTRGMNALISLVVPGAALLLALALRATTNMILHLIMAIGLLNAALGFAQIVTGPNSPLYFYMYVSPRSAAGLFANENHSAVFSVLVLLIIARLAGENYVTDKSRVTWTPIFYPAAFVIVLLTVLVTGSRAGLGGLVVALAACAAMAFRLSAGRVEEKFKSGQARFGKLGGAAGLAMVFTGLVISLIALFFLQERTPALRDLLDKNPFEDLRWQILPIIQTMARTHWLWGSGFGSFDVLYQSYEPTELLFVSYLNQAHNDWLQLVIEGGLLACLILACLLVWSLKAILVIARSKDVDQFAMLVVFWIAVFLVIGAASLADYPLRTPIYQAVGVWLLVCLASDQRRVRVVRR